MRQIFSGLAAAAVLAVLAVPASAQTVQASGSVGAFFTVSSSQSNYYVTRAFKAPSNALCQVTTTAQLFSTVPPTAGGTVTYLRVAVSRDGVESNDGILRDFMTSTGAPGYQPAVTRTALFPITAGQTVQFGAQLGSSVPWQGANLAAQTTYLCF